MSVSKCCSSPSHLCSQPDIVVFKSFFKSYNSTRESLQQSPAVCGGSLHFCWNRIPCCTINSELISRGPGLIKQSRRGEVQGGEYSVRFLVLSNLDAAQCEARVSTRMRGVGARRKITWVPPSADCFTQSSRAWRYYTILYSNEAFLWRLGSARQASADCLYYFLALMEAVR